MTTFVLVTSFLTTLLLIIFSYWKKNHTSTEKSSDSAAYHITNSITTWIHAHDLWIAGFLFFLLLFTSFFKIAEIPYGLNVDEAGMAYDAYLLANYGVDRYNNFLPVYLINFGGGQSSLYAYLSAIAIKLFGYSIYSIRTPIAIVRFFMSLSAFYISRKFASKLQALLLLFLLTICPYFIMQSRWGLDCNLFYFSVIICVATTTHISKVNMFLATILMRFHFATLKQLTKYMYKQILLLSFRFMFI